MKFARYDILYAIFLCFLGRRRWRSLGESPLLSAAATFASYLQVASKLDARKTHKISRQDGRSWLAVDAMCASCRQVASKLDARKQQCKRTTDQQAAAPREALHRRGERFKHGDGGGAAAHRTRSSRRSRRVCGGRGAERRRPPRSPEEHQRAGEPPQLGGRFGDGSLCRNCAA